MVAMVDGNGNTRPAGGIRWRRATDYTRHDSRESVAGSAFGVPNVNRGHRPERRPCRSEVGVRPTVESSVTPQLWVARLGGLPIPRADSGGIGVGEGRGDDGAVPNVRRRGVGKGESRGGRGGPSGVCKPPNFGSDLHRVGVALNALHHLNSRIVSGCHKGCKRPVGNRAVFSPQSIPLLRRSQRSSGRVRILRFSRSERFRRWRKLRPILQPARGKQSGQPAVLENPTHFSDAAGVRVLQCHWKLPPNRKRPSTDTEVRPGADSHQWFFCRPGYPPSAGGGHAHPSLQVFGAGRR
jgi:hypothetical protein